MWSENPFTGLINKAKQIVNNYVSSKVERVVSLAKAYIKEKADNILNSMKPSNPFTRAKADKPDKVSGKGGTSITTEGGKEGPMAIPEGDRNVKTADMTNLMVFAVDVFGAETVMPGAAPDGSNPLQTENGSSNSNGSSISKSNTTEVDNSKSDKASIDTVFSVTRKIDRQNNHIDFVTGSKKADSIIKENPKSTKKVDQIIRNSNN